MSFDLILSGANTMSNAFNLKTFKSPVALLLAIALSSCTGSAVTRSNGGSTAEDLPEGTLQIVTTFLPMTNFTQAIAGDRATVTQLLPLNVTPHDYQAKPQDVRRLAEADVLIENGLALESFLVGLVENADNPDLTVVDASEGIAVVPFNKEHSLENEQNNHNHDHNHEHDDDPSNHHGDHHDEAHDHGEYDPHVWLDPKRAIQQVENIRDALIATDLEGADTYTANAAAYIQKLQTLDSEISEALSAYNGQSFVTYHDFAHYFATGYGLEVIHLVRVPEDNATPADVQRVIQAVKASQLKTLLSEPQQNDSPFAAIAQDLSIQVSVFDPLETSGPEGLNPDYYLTVMGQNLDNLKAAFSQSSP